ncbi:Protein of unknown function [Bacillus cereus]|nr:Protein of unknown function [Bacillus wiedmannii]SCC61358.1 Protein of unknown function [Bacillus thuringiensis]SCC62491.1 Protein of unknown function [Bacillus cereus]SCC60851.1 Protein of unknown function [Bacillus wiedmannii]SCM07090.1 Protein of unknown function [Bacillus wiedmannii]
MQNINIVLVDADA